jgi:1-phosphatidylinositol-5-phosphate 4-kinase
LEKQLPTLKDNDFIKHHVKIHIGHQAKEKLLASMQADVDVSIRFENNRKN